MPVSELTVAELEKLLGDSTEVAEFRASFSVLQPDGTSIDVELTMPVGKLRQYIGHDRLPDIFEPVSLASSGRLVVLLQLFPERSPGQQNSATVKWRTR